MTTYYEQLAAAQQEIADADAGKYDDSFGVTPEQRDVLTRAADSDEQLTVADVKVLTALHRPDLIDAAYQADRINLNQED